MPEGSTTDPTTSTPRRRRWRRVLLWSALTLTLVLVAGISTTYGYYRQLHSAMARHDLSDSLDEEERPPKIGEAVNILLIGSDSRANENADYGFFEGERSDSLLLVHVSPDHDDIIAVNFPRDSLVQIPECAPYDGAEGTQGYYGMINAALFHGGPPCTIKTIETLTDIHIDHFVGVSFVGFRDMIDAVGGVEMCIPEPLEDERAKLDLDAGEQTLDGEEALAFVRARYEIGDGSDAGRIDRQQMFLAAFADEVLSSDLLTRPNQLMALLEAVSEHTTTDSGLTLNRMVSIGTTMTGTDLRDISFYTVPSWPAPSDPNRVIWNEERADILFEAIANDETIDEELLVDADPEPAEGDDLSSPSPSYPAEVEPEEDTGPRTGTRDRIERRDGTADPCEQGLGTGTEDWG